jgi:hypothetical protein
MHILFLMLIIMSSDAIGTLWAVSLQVEFEQPHMGSYAAYEDDDYKRLRVVSCCFTFLHTTPYVVYLKEPAIKSPETRNLKEQLSRCFYTLWPLSPTAMSLYQMKTKDQLSILRL